jgi:glycosyltransferase involved in cell wall biosynthesis
VNQVVINLARDMQISGDFIPIILIADWDATNPVWEEIEGLKTVRWRIRSFSIGMSVKERMSYWLWEKKFRIQFQTFCLDHRIVVINPHYPGAVAVSVDRVRRAFKSQISFFLSFHGGDLTNIKNECPLVIASWKKIFLHVDAVIVCSIDLGRKFLELFNDQIHLHVIHNGLNTDAFIALTPSSTIASRPFILNVGKFENKKGQDVLIEAFANIAHIYPKLDLVLIGAIDDRLPVLRSQCAKRGVESRVQFFLDMPHKQVANFFRQAIMFVLPSRQEPFGIVVLEAGAFGLPVIASDVGGIPEIMTDGVTGYLVPPADVAALEKRMRILLDRPDVAKEMGRRLHDHVKRNFTWAVAGAKYKALLNPERISK